VTSIDIDFDVFKALTLRREAESTSYNDVLRQLLGLGEATSSPPSIGSGNGCVMQGVHFPEGTEFRVTYKGVTHTASIKGGRWVDSEGRVRRSPSHAATAITGNNVNGWRFWSFRRPDGQVFRKMRELQDG
jgi:hypothetical protein